MTPALRFDEEWIVAQRPLRNRVTPFGEIEPLPLTDAVIVKTSIEKNPSIVWFAATFENVCDVTAP